MKIWWLRSPGTDIYYRAWYLISSGNAVNRYNVYDYSYGSPYTAGISIWNTYPDGTIVGNHDGYFYSYGHLFDGLFQISSKKLAVSVNTF